jgi:hypothetical protein
MAITTQPVNPQGERRHDACEQLYEELVSIARQKVTDKQLTRYQRDILKLFTNDSDLAFVAACHRCGLNDRVDGKDRTEVPGKFLGITATSLVCANAWRAGYDGQSLQRYAIALLSHTMQMVALPTLPIKTRPGPS